MHSIRGRDHSDSPSPYHHSADMSSYNNVGGRARSRSNSPAAVAASSRRRRGYSRSKSRSHSPPASASAWKSRGHKHHKYERSSASDDDRDYRREKDFYDDERSPSRDRSGYRERKERGHHRDKEYRRSSGSSRWSDDRRERDRYRERERDRENGRDSDDSDSSCGGMLLGASGSEIIGYKSQPPNHTIMIRGLAQHITENDIRQDIIQCGLMPKDIRLIRKKDTGASRGFAFVEFSTVGEAVRWMEMKQGILMLQDQYRAIMQYSIPKELCPQSEKAPSHKASADWFCIKCGAQNFKRRELCFKCHASRMESEEGGSGSDEICTYTTKTIMLRNLDALTTEDTIMSVLSSVIAEHVKKISAVAIGRDPLTSTSRGICYLGTESTVDAMGIYAALNNVTPPLSIDGKTVILSYCKYNMGDTKHLYSEPESHFHSAAVPTNYSLNDVDSLAEYSANKYAKNGVEYQHYLSYYKNYFTQQINAGHSITLQQENQMDAANAAAAVAQSAIQQLHANKTFFDSTHMSVPNGTDGKRYPIPDVTKYTYDKSSGYYYDATTGLYYDQTSQYYWNSVIQKYLYWDREKLTYVLAPSSYDQYANQTPAEDAQQGQTAKKPKADKNDKVKVAKKIAKDMERWAKTLNQKKDMQPMRQSDAYGGGAGGGSGSADIGFSVLEKKASNHISNGYTDSDMSNTQAAGGVPAASSSSSAPPLVAAYGGESESSDDDEPKINDIDFLDFTKLICNLCKRMLPSTDALSKHAQFSAIHKQNLEALKAKRRKGGDGGPPTTAGNSSTADKANIVYRDRAKERRLKYGDPDEPTPSKLKEKYLKSRDLEPPAQPVAAKVSEPIGAENVGNRLLQKMGWTEGQGLGKSNQGRTTIIQAEQRVSSVGLGNKAGTYQAVAGESYKDCVKKMMYARYQELAERD